MTQGQDDLSEKTNKMLREQKFPKPFLNPQTPDEEAGDDRIEAQKEITGEHTVTVFKKDCDPDLIIISFWKSLLNKLKV